MVDPLLPIRSEKNLFIFYIRPILIFALCIATGIMLVFFSLKGDFDRKTGNDGVQLVIGVILIFGVVAYAKARIQHAKNIYIDTEKVLIGKTVFFIEQIQVIKLTRRKALTFLSPPGSVTIFIINNGTSHIFFDKLYRNEYELKQFIELHYGSLVEGFAATIPEPLPDEDFETFYTFKGNLMLSWRFYLVIFFFIVFIKAGIFSRDINNISRTVLSIAMLIILFGAFLQFNYFELSAQTLVVKKFFLFGFFSRRYKLSGIREVVFERGDRSARSLRIIQRNFSSQSFSAASLLTTDWIEFKKVLESSGIVVRTENIDWL